MRGRRTVWYHATLPLVLSPAFTGAGRGPSAPRPVTPSQSVFSSHRARPKAHASSPIEPRSCRPNITPAKSQSRPARSSLRSSRFEYSPSLLCPPPPQTTSPSPDTPDTYSSAGPPASTSAGHSTVRSGRSLLLRCRTPRQVGRACPGRRTGSGGGRSTRRRWGRSGT